MTAAIETPPKGAGLSALSLSVVIPTRAPWSDLESNLRTVEASVAAIGGEVIVLDGSGQAQPPGLAKHTRWISAPGESIYQLKARGYRTARGEVVASTEDHCTVPPEWAARVVAAHRSWPEAAVVCGAVDNGAASTVIDWASFFVNSAAFMAPLHRGPTERGTTHINISYKKRALTNIRDVVGLGMIDAAHVRALSTMGAVVVHDDSVRVTHIQSLGLIGTTTLHFHAGRTISGFRRSGMSPRQFVRACATFGMPPVRLVRTVRAGWQKHRRRELLTSIPWMAWLLCAQAAGQLLGYIAGAGDSPNQVA